jgi:hypothetical protein
MRAQAGTPNRPGVGMTKILIADGSDVSRGQVLQALVVKSVAWSRKGADWTERMPAIAAAFARFPARQCPSATRITGRLPPRERRSAAIALKEH